MDTKLLYQELMVAVRTAVIMITTVTTESVNSKHNSEHNICCGRSHYPEVGGSIFLHSVGTHQANYTVHIELSMTYT
jgi:hypothetical protein